MPGGLISALAQQVYLHVLSRKRPSRRRMASPDDNGRVLDCCIAYNRHGAYCVPLSSRHRPAAQRILSGAVYEAATIDFLATHCGTGDVVHAGTYFGDFLPALARACAPGARVWAFEPNRESFRCALVTTHLNGLDNVELTHAGLGEGEGACVLKVREAGRALGGASHVVGAAAATTAAGTERARIVALDEVIPEDRRISVVHLDVEGYETPALTGALRTIARCSPVVVVERLPEAAWLAENLIARGYRVGPEIQGNTVLTPGC